MRPRNTLPISLAVLALVNGCGDDMPVSLGTSQAGLTTFGAYGTFFVDMDGDHLADQVLVNANGIIVRRSTGTSFGPDEPWTETGYFGTRGTYFADVTGDGRADAIVVNDNGVTVRSSTGTRPFDSGKLWTEVGYYGSRGTYFADVTGGGKADAIVVNDNAVVVRPASGTPPFGPNELWTEVGYYGSRGTYFADVTGDGRADAIAVNDNAVVVRPSSGTRPFGPNELWTEVGYYGSRGTYFADVTGDGRADAIVVNDNAVVVRPATILHTFGANELWTESGYYGSRGTYFADVTGDGRADAIVVNDNAVVVRRSTGMRQFGPYEYWLVAPSSPPPQPSPSFSVSVTAPVSQLVGWDQSATYSVKMQGQNGFAGQVTLSLDNLPNGLNSPQGFQYSFAPNPIGPGQTSTLTVQPKVAMMTPANSYALRVQGTSPGLASQTDRATLSIRRSTGNFSLAGSPRYVTSTCNTVTAEVIGTQVRFKGAGFVTSWENFSYYRFSPACRGAVVIPAGSPSGVLLYNLGLYGKPPGSSVFQSVPWQNFYFSADDSLLLIEGSSGGNSVGAQVASLFDMIQLSASDTNFFTGTVGTVALVRQPTQSRDRVDVNLSYPMGTISLSAP